MDLGATAICCSSVMRAVVGTCVASFALAFAVCPALSASRLTKTEYEQRMQAVGRAYTQDLKTVTRQAGSGNLARSTLQQKQTVAVYTRLVLRLSVIHPPADVGKDHRILLTAFRTMVKWFTASERAAERGDGPTAFALSVRATTDPIVRRGQDAEIDMKRRGYRLGVFTKYV